MRVIRGSHRTGQLDHALKPEEEGSMLRRGQQVEDVSEEEGEVMALRAGEMSIHNPFTLHCSGPNTTQVRPYPTTRYPGRHHTLVQNDRDLCMSIVPLRYCRAPAEPRFVAAAVQEPRVGVVLNFLPPSTVPSNAVGSATLIAGQCDAQHWGLSSWRPVSSPVACGELRSKLGRFRCQAYASPWPRE